MSAFALLKLDGELENEGFRVTLEIRRGNSQSADILGHLPPALALAQQLQDWEKHYRSLAAPYQPRGIQPMGIYLGGSINRRQIIQCQESARSLVDQFNRWLDDAAIKPICDQLRSSLSPKEEICLLVRSPDFNLYKLPWHEWNLLANFPYTTITFAPFQFQDKPDAPASIPPNSPRILAILGHRQGINLDKDTEELKKYTQAEVVYFDEPQRQELNDQLWENSWDILFFAGHSETEGDRGRIYLNPQDSLTLSELSYGLKKAVAKGLKIAIFNSCDGLGLAQELQDCHIPHIIVMRELVPDRVAQEFFKYFLSNFAQEKYSFYRAVRESQQRLQALEPEFPCATWLPAIYQQPTAQPPAWQDFKSDQLSWQQIFGKVALWSAIATGTLFALRGLGWLEPLELKAFDGLMQQRFAESSIDKRILVVEIGEEDTNRYGYPIPDNILAKLLGRLSSYHPRAIGLDIHRYQKRGEGRQDFIRRFQENNHLIAICAFGTSEKQYNPPPELLAQPALQSQLGFSNLLQDPDNKIRRQLLSYSPQQASSPATCSTAYSLNLQLAYRYLDQEGVHPLSVTAQQQWQLGSVILQPLSSRFGGYQSLDGNSSQIMINYRAGKLPGQRVSLDSILTGSFAPELIHDKVILIGYTSPVAREIFSIPGGEMPGVWVHAQMTSQLLSAVLDKRSLIRVLPQWQALQWGDALIVFIGCFSGGVILLRIQSRSRYPLWAWALTVPISLGLVYSLSLFALQGGLWLPFVPATLSWMIVLVLLFLKIDSIKAKKP